jgi:hypothetical protein
MGTIAGGVLGIIVWEIARGNPYGLAVLTFFVMWPLYYIFFTSPIFNITAIMTQVTMMLVSNGRKDIYDAFELTIFHR